MRSLLTAALLVLLAAATCGADGPLPTPNAIHDAAQYTTKLRAVENGVLYEVSGMARAHNCAHHVHVKGIAVPLLVLSTTSRRGRALCGCVRMSKLAMHASME